MNKLTKIIISGVLALIIFYIGYFIYGIIRYSGSTTWDHWKEYTWVFKDTFIQELDTIGNISVIYDDATYTLFHDKKNNIIELWEFNSLGNSDLKSMSINENVYIDYESIEKGEILQSNSSLPIKVKYRFSFNNKLNINVDKSSKINRWIEGENYKGFYGNVNRMSFCNENGENIIISQFDEEWNYLGLLQFKIKNRFFILNYISKTPINENMTDIINLN